MSTYTPIEHRDRHIELHDNLDELLADWVRNTESAGYLSQPIINLINWSHKQTLTPDHPPTGKK